MNTPLEVIELWTAKILGCPEMAQRLKARYKFIVTGQGGGTWLFDCRDQVSVSDKDGQADCTLTMNSNTFMDLANGKLNPQVAFLMQQIELSGDSALALRLAEIL